MIAATSISGGHTPVCGAGVFVAASATVIGQVRLGDGASIWYGTVVRGDIGSITVGARTNIQDLCVVHVTGGGFDTVIGDEVTVGHRAVLHGCTVASHCLVGMGAVLLDGASVGEGSIIGAGAVVTPGTEIPAGCVAFGSPARVVRPVSAAERAGIDASARSYLELAALHRDIR